MPAESTAFISHATEDRAAAMFPPPRGDIPEAKPLLEQVRDGRSRHLAPDHAQTQAVAARLAQVE
jgi:hypothetical protein